MVKDIRECYTKHSLDEWKRLAKNPFHKIEFDTTMRFLKKYLPKKGYILDAGGGPGRYTIELAKLGYQITLLDYTPALLKIARKRIKSAGLLNKVRSIVEGSIVDLSRFKSNTFDAVICLSGPLSHIQEEKQRNKAVSELTRVAKKRAPIFISVMGKIGVLLIIPDFPEEIAMTKHFRSVYKHGDDDMWVGPYYCHFFEPKELKQIFTKHKIRLLELIGLEGLSTPNPEKINDLAKNKKAWKNWMELHYATCTDPTIVDISQHILAIGRK